MRYHVSSYQSYASAIISHSTIGTEPIDSVMDTIVVGAEDSILQDFELSVTRSQLGSSSVWLRLTTNFQNTSGNNYGNNVLGVRDIKIVVEDHQLFEVVDTNIQIDSTRYAVSGEYRYGFNGMERDDEVKGTGNSYTTQFRMLDPRLGRWWSTDPVVHYGMSPYNSFDNNPVYWVDPWGSNAGDYYKKDGTYLGSDGVDDDKTYTADGKNEDGTFENAEELEIKHSDFKYISGVVAKEDASKMEGAAATAQATFNAVKLIKGSDISMSEQSGFAADLLATAYSSVPIKTPLATRDATETANNARAGLIHVMNGGKDFSNGAVAWDGVDFGVRGGTHPKGKDGGFSISKDLYTQFKGTYNWPVNYKGDKWRPAKLDFSKGDYNKPGTGRYSKGRVAYKGVAVHGQHIFWAPNRSNPANKGYNFKDLISFDF